MARGDSLSIQKVFSGDLTSPNPPSEGGRLMKASGD
jgi:hypothetical protein